VVQLDHVGKRYWKLQDQAMLLRSLLPWTRPQKTESWALRDLDLEVGRGETVGIMGRNGAGKTTLLRLLAGVTQPTEGVVRVNGRIAPLLSVGVGFHQEMSGRENVYVNAMLLGLTKAQVAERFDDIVAFAELADFIDVPVKFYSSGMYMRLGFAVAIHVDPQVLVVDEVLAVGDVAFQLKCFDRIRELQTSGATVVMVSHSMHVIRLLCPRALLMHHGQLVFDGEAEETISRHHQILSSGASDNSGRQVEGPVTILHRSLTRDGEPTNACVQDDLLALRCAVRFNRDIDSPQVAFRVIAEDGTLAYGMHSAIGREWHRYAAGDVAEVTAVFRPRFGGGGTFRLITEVTDTSGSQVLLTDFDGPRLYVPPRLGTSGLGDAGAELRVDGTLLSDHEELTLRPNGSAAVSGRSGATA
jgi:ABC-2 type transport system ATP-binding protein